MGKKKTKSKRAGIRNIRQEQLEQGIAICAAHPLFGRMGGYTRIRDNQMLGKNNAAMVTRHGEILVNQDMSLPPKQWAYIIAHCKLHLAFGHFDKAKMPENCEKTLWNFACDLFVAKFLADIKFGEAVCSNPADVLAGSLTDEKKIYAHLLEGISVKGESISNIYGTASGMDMIGLENPNVYDKEKNEYNPFAAGFANALSSAVTVTVGKAGGHIGDNRMSEGREAAKWFVNHYPLLGSLASSFGIIEDYTYCVHEEIQVAGVNVSAGEIYLNPAVVLGAEELKFVMAHEFLHAGLGHQERCRGRDSYLWNVACDYVINGWLCEMKVGEMPEGSLYDESLKNKSAEEIYDLILTDMRKYHKLDTFRGYGKGDMMAGKGVGIRGKQTPGMTMDEFCRNALMQGLEYQQSYGRGYLPAGLVQEIRVLAMPPIGWDVELARWFEEQFPYMDKIRTYARPSRRQGATPDIPRPRYMQAEFKEDARTFGVILDTSGSMSAKAMGMALGSIASYAAVREVPYARVVFCDADAYDAGYLSPEDVAGRVEVKGRGGTMLQPGIDLLECAKDFPKDGPILIITDGEIEDKLTIRRKHAYLIPKGKNLPFRAKGQVFYFS